MAHSAYPIDLLGGLFVGKRDGWAWPLVTAHFMALAANDTSPRQPPPCRPFGPRAPFMLNFETGRAWRRR